MLTFPLAVPPETPIKKGVLLSMPLNFPLIPKDIFRVMPIFVDMSAIVKHAETTKLILLEINSRQQNTLLSKGFGLTKQNNVTENYF